MNKLTLEEIQKVIDASNALNIIDYSLLEKDIFVIRIIQAISTMNYPGIHLVFCGGTCLAKAYQIISRMSEDIDFKIFPEVPFLSQSDKQKKLNRFHHKIKNVLTDAGFNIEENNLYTRDKKGYVVTPLILRKTKN